MKKRTIFFALTFLLCLACALMGAACANTVTLTFESNGGTPAGAVTAEAGEAFLFPETSKEGFVFDGWYTEPDFSGTKHEDTATAPDRDTTYYAKWAQGYEVKLELDGGTLSATSVWLKEGDNVYDALKDLTPSKSGLTFGAWFNGENELSRAFRMPAETITLTAKYKVDYIIQIFLQNVSRNTYQRDDLKEVAGSGYVNTEVTPETPEVENFVPQPSPEGKEPVMTRVLSENADENVYSMYYDRMEYVVAYQKNAPVGETVAGTIAPQIVVFEDKIAVAENLFTLDGYRFAGWATSENGAVVYDEGDDLVVRGPTFLYAVWDKGFTDRYGGADLVFFPRNEPEVAVLWRNGMEFEGTRNGDEFSFHTPSGIDFGGKVFGSMYCYALQDVEGTYTYYNNTIDPALTDESMRYDFNRTLYVDKYLNAVYTENGVKTEGVLEFYADQGDYLFTSNDGETVMHLLFRKNAANEQSGPDNGYPKDIFAVGSDEFGYYVNSSQQPLVLDGYGTAFLQILLSTGNQYALTGYYYIEGQARIFDQFDTYKIVCWINDTAGILNGVVGWQVYYICAVPDYWEDMGAEYGYYTFADTSRGTYEDGKGGTLVLDGHGYYEDSAVYTAADGTQIAGPYGVRSDFVSGSVVSIGEEDNIVAQFHLSSDGSFSSYDGPETEYVEYYELSGTSLQPPLLAIFEKPYPGKENSKQAEMYSTNSKGVGVHAASGYVTWEKAAPDSEVLLYTFVRTAVEYGFDNTIPTNMVFTLTVVKRNNTSVTYQAYSVLERNGEKLYDVIELANGGTVWANGNIGVDGEGSLYFINNNAYHASFPTYQDEYFGRIYGELLSLGIGEKGQLYVLNASNKVGVRYFAEPTSGRPAEYYYFDPMLSYTNGVFLELVLAPDGRAMYDDTGEGEYFKQNEGIYRETDEVTRFGSRVYEFVIGGETRMKFVLSKLYFLGYTYDGFFLYTGGEGTYDTQNGGTLTLDGYGTALYTLNGVETDASYYFLSGASGTGDLKGKIVRLIDADGNEYEFEFEDGENVYALDPIYGTWDLVDGNFRPINNFAKITFDGKGTYTIVTRPLDGSLSQTTSGYYVLSDAAYEEYTLLNVTIEGHKGNYNCRFMEYVEYNNFNCVVQERSSGVFTDENYNVLSLNGFGSGVFQGNGIQSMGNFYIVDKELGFGYFIFTEEYSAYEGEMLYVLLDTEDGSFEIVEYDSNLFYADDLDHIVFRDDGSVFLGNLINGEYLVTEEGVNVYLYDQENYTYNKTVLPFFNTDEYEYNGKKYYRYTQEKFTADGTIYMWDSEDVPGKTPTVEASISFDAVLRGMTNLPTTFTIGGKTYEGYVLTTYTRGAFKPRIEYNNIAYQITFSRGADGEWKFDVSDAGVRVLERHDVNDRFYNGSQVSSGQVYSGGKLDVRYNGFGGYTLEEITYSGKFYYLHQDGEDDMITFDNVPASQVRKVGYHNLGTNYGGYHDLLEIVFEHNGKRYAIDFYEYSSGSFASVMTYTYLLHGFYEYDEVDAGDYRMGVKYLLYANLSGSPGYADDTAIGKPMAITLLGGANKDRPVAEIAGGVRYGGKGIWFVEDNDGRSGDAYLITFAYEGDRVTSGTVQIGSVQTVGLSASYNFYLFIDGNGDIGEIMVAWYGSTQFESVTDIEKDPDDDLVWTFKGKESSEDPERAYTLIFKKGTSGRYTVTVETELIEKP